MRVTFQSQYRDAAAGIEAAQERMTEFQRQVATGLRVQKASDDPAAAALLVGEKAELTKGEQYSRAANSVTSRLTVVDSLLDDMIEKLTAAQSSTTAARGTGKVANEREASAQALTGVRNALLEDLNTTFHGVYVFAGAASQTKPFTESGGVVSAYAGSTTEVSLDVADSRTLTIGFDGSVISQGSDVNDIFTELDALITAVRNGDEAGMDTGMAALKRAMDRASVAQMRVGVALQAAEAEQENVTTAKLATTERISKLEDADLASAVTGMTQADAAYRAALSAIGTASKVSLMDYLG